MTNQKSRPASGRAFAGAAAAALVLLVLLGYYQKHLHVQTVKEIGHAADDPFVFQTSSSERFVANEQRLAPARKAIEAIRDNRPDDFRRLLTTGLNPDTRYGTTGTLLYKASAAGRLEIVQMLLKRGAKVEAFNKNSPSPLFVAALKGHTGIMAALMQAGGYQTDRVTTWCGVNEDRLSVSPSFVVTESLLMAACGGGHLATVRYLLDHGADINLRDPNRRTALGYAVQGGNDAIIKLLMARGAEPKPKTGGGFRPLLSEACASGNIAIARYAIDQGADINRRDRQGGTALHDAAFEGQIKCVQLLLNHGADTAVRDNAGRTALRACMVRGDYQIIQLLMTARGQLPDVDTANDLLIYASPTPHTDVAAYAIEHHADVNRPDRYGYTPLFYAGSSGSADMVRLLLKHGANTNVTNNSGETPLDFAQRENHRRDPEIDALLAPRKPH